MCECDVWTRFPLAGLERGEWGGGGKRKTMPKLNTKIANTILLIYYFDQCCGTGTGTKTVGTVTFCLVEPEPEQ